MNPIYEKKQREYEAKKARAKALALRLTCTIRATQGRGADPRTRETLGRVRVRGRQIPRTLASGTGAGTDEKPRVRGTPLTLEGVPRLADLLISVRGRVMQLPGCRVGPKAA